MYIDFFQEKYSKLSAASLISGILALSFCILYFFIWMIFDNLLERLIADYAFMSYIILSFVCAGICLTIAAAITGIIVLKRTREGVSTRKGRGFAITGIVLGSILILFGIIFYLAEFFGIVNIIT